ncbi:hypothetical protein JAAARDRAFT_192672 [Jaapia argillacea MUCL 33604]|uniref:Terpene synthase n=1 Tax=Jaapia argillacea MUCL 33604 TaxID=933084 RepID=A0A067PWC7_9AGAM|nr:hypothetical protein JAAARDRAFT_192672 [Jaapia argillacea MUCL 33604]
MPGATSTSQTFLLPDLLAHFPLSPMVNPSYKSVSASSKSWVQSHTARPCVDLDGILSTVHDPSDVELSGLLAALCFPSATKEELRICADVAGFLGILHEVVDASEEGEVEVLEEVLTEVLCGSKVGGLGGASVLGGMASCVLERLQQRCSKGVHHRLTNTIQGFIHSMASEASSRAQDKFKIPDLESYIVTRRNTSGCKPLLSLVEFASGVDLADDVIEHPVVQGMREVANDIVTWASDIFSYEYEDPHCDDNKDNMVSILMHPTSLGLSCQSAVDFIGDLCIDSISHFLSLRRSLPSWGPEVDPELDVYVDCLESWVVGSLYWMEVSSQAL